MQLIIGIPQFLTLGLRILVALQPVFIEGNVILLLLLVSFLIGVPLVRDGLQLGLEGMDSASMVSGAPLELLARCLVAVFFADNFVKLCPGFCKSVTESLLRVLSCREAVSCRRGGDKGAIR